MILSIHFKAVLILILLSFYPASAWAGDKVVLTTHNLYPYGSYPEETLKIKNIADVSFRGIAVDVVACVFERMAIPLEIKVVPWKRAQALVQNGRADGFFAASQKDSRDQFAVMSKVIADQKWMWYLLRENPMCPHDADFKAKATVGSFLGANMLKWMKENGYHVTATPQDTEGLLMMLINKRVHAVMANNYVMDALIAKHDLKNRVKMYFHKNKPLGVYFSHRFLNSRPGFLENFNSFVSDCRSLQ